MKLLLLIIGLLLMLISCKPYSWERYGNYYHPSRIDYDLYYYDDVNRYNDGLFKRDYECYDKK